MDLVATPADPIPEGAHVEWLTAADGTRLRVARWIPSGAARGTIVFLNGRTEFIEKYFETMAYMIDQGFALATLDWRGQGRSDRPLPNPQCGHVEDFAFYVDDLHQMIEDFVVPFCPAPLHAVAHSLGGHIALRYVHDHPGRIERAMFMSPMWGVGRFPEPASWMKALGTLARTVGWGGRYVPFIGKDYGEKRRRFEGNVLTSSRARFERMVAQIDADPRLALGAPTFGWMREAMGSIELTLAPGYVEAIAIPVCVCSATQDTVVPPQGHARLAARMPRAELVLFEGAMHELFIEVDAYRNRALATFDAFME